MDSPALFFGEFAGALEDSLACRLCHWAGVWWGGGDGTLRKDLKYVSTHFCVEDLLTEFVLKPKYLSWLLK